MQYRLVKSLDTDALDSAALAIMRRGDLIQHWNMIVELGLGNLQDYDRKVRKVPELQIHIESIRSTWNSIVRQRRCTLTMIERMGRNKVIHLNPDAFFNATGRSTLYMREFTRSNKTAVACVKRYNRHLRYA